jgi:hypothetical protein
MSQDLKVGGRSHRDQEAAMRNETTALSQFHYVDARHVRGGGAYLGCLDVREEAGPRIGTLEGMIVDVKAGRVRYLVVHSDSRQSRHWQVLPFVSARLDRDDRALRVDLDRALAAPSSRFDRVARLRIADDDRTTVLS